MGGYYHRGSFYVNKNKFVWNRRDSLSLERRKKQTISSINMDGVLLIVLRRQIWCDE